MCGTADEAIRELYSRFEKQDRTVELLSVHINGNEAAFLARLTVITAGSRTRIDGIDVMTFDDEASDHVDAGVLVRAADHQSLIAACRSATVANSRSASQPGTSPKEVRCRFLPRPRTCRRRRTSRPS